MSASSSQADIVVVGGGLAGLAAAASAASRGLETLHLAPPAPLDRRTSALMGPSVSFLVESGLIGDPAELGVPLTRIRIIDATNRLVRAPETLFDSAEAGLDGFGWNFANAGLLEAFRKVAAATDTYSTREAKFRALEKNGDGYTVTTDDGTTIACKLVIGADGRNSPVRQAAGIDVRLHRYSQAALVCDLELDRPLGGTSVEFHYPDGPFTLVPAGDKRANLVWIDGTKTLDAVRTLDAAGFAATIEARAQHLFGHMHPTGPTAMFPLSTLAAYTAGRDGVVLVGESAHAFPPIGAQGLNLGLRDVADLMEVLESTDRSQAGWADTVADSFAGRRAADLMRTSAMVDALFRSLLSDMLPAHALRAGGLWALKLLSPLRRQAMTTGMGKR